MSTIKALRFPVSVSWRGGRLPKLRPIRYSDGNVIGNLEISGNTVSGEVRSLRCQS